MELSERELLIKIEQQLKSLSDSHKEVLTEISTIFDKQDSDSKTLAVLKSDFSNHVEAYKLHKQSTEKSCENCESSLDKRLTKAEGHVEKLFAQLERYRIQSAEVKTTSDALPKEVEKEMKNNFNSLQSYIDKKVTEEKTSRETFENTLNTSIKSSKFFISIIAFLITLVTSIVYPLLIEVLKRWLL